MRFVAALTLAAFVCAPGALLAQDAPKAKAKPVAASASPKKGSKTCRYTFPNEKKPVVWSCAADEPCCAWDLIHYTKCGSPITKCL